MPKFLLGFYHYSLAFFGALLFGFPSKNLIIIGVTGTSGKSTTVDFITRILEEAGYPVASLSSIRFKIGKKEWENEMKMTMPGRFIIQKFLRQAVREKCKYVVLEVTSEGIKQFRHKFIQFNTAVFNNLTLEHVESHGGFENYRNEKLKLFRVTSNLHIVNADDENASYFLNIPAKKVVTFGINNVSDVHAEDLEGLSFSVDGVHFTLPLLGRFNVYNALAAIAVAVSHEIPLETAKAALEEVVGISGRMEVVGQDPLVVVDYAHTPDQLEWAYKSLNNRSLVCVLGSCGGGRDKWKRPVLGQIANQYCKTVIVTNEDPYDENPMEIIDQVATGAPDKAIKILDRKEAIKKAITIAKIADTVVITGKGSEPLMCLANGKKIPWDDCQIARDAFTATFAKKEAIVVLGGKTNLEGRVKEAVQLFNSGVAHFIILSGGHPDPETGKKTHTEAKIMKKMATDLGVPQNALILEEDSLDTVGNAYYAKKILENYGWNNIVVVVLDYHKDRASYAFSKVLGIDYHVEYHVVPNEFSGAELEKRMKKERETMEHYQAWLNEMPSGDQELIKEALYKNHPDYRNP